MEKKIPKTIDSEQLEKGISQKTQENERIRRTTQTTLEGDTTWDFLRSFSVKESHEYTHGLHIYPAKIVPQIARELIAKLSTPLSVVLDPFCGSGTVLVESLMSNRNAVGVDINTLALLVARVKTTPISPEIIFENLNLLVDNVKKLSKENLPTQQKLSIEKIPNIYHWFKPYVAEDLGFLRTAIQEITDQTIQNFFYVCFSSTMYHVSNIRKADNPYFIRILHQEEMKKHKPQVLDQFIKTVKQSSKALKSIQGAKKHATWIKIFNASTKDLTSLIGNETVDLIVTSPPYGEEKNTMDYARFSKLSMYWLGLDGKQVKEMKMNALGSTLRHWEQCELASKTLGERLEEISKKSQQRADEVYSFFCDYLICLRQMFEVTKHGGNCCIVIGDRTASGVSIPNGKITSELCEDVGFTTIENVQRKMYLRALRSNVIASENVLIVRRP